MSRWRIAVLLVLGAVPLLFFIVLGSFRLWQLGLGVYVWWPLSGCMALGYILAWHWMRQRQLIRPSDVSPPLHWTERDREAWKLVEARTQLVAAHEPGQFHDLQYYVATAQELALELARFYHPKAEDPITSLRVPEVLAVVELVAHDLAELVEQNVPGSHVMTIKDWHWAKQTVEKATNWYRGASNLWWLASAVLSPIDTGLRYAASHAGMSQPLKLLQQDLIAWFHTAFIHHLGKYLIDLNSGRLRVGAKRYRELSQAVDDDPTAPLPEAMGQITLTVLGQVKMGKSSFVNALLGDQRARADVLPATNNVTRYELKLPGMEGRLALNDTVGYAHTGAREDQVKATQEAAAQSDLLILVLHARNPARQADLDMLRALTDWFAIHPELKLPPILAAVTHIDLLSPAMEWSPPYDWQQPHRPKEEQIQQALLVVREQFGSQLVAAVPVCTAAGKVYGVADWFLPALLEQLGTAKGVALLRCLRAEADAATVRKVFDQLLHVGQHAARIWWQAQAKH